MSNFVQALKPRLRSFRESLYLLARNKLSLAAFILLIIIVLAAVAAPLIVPYPGDIEMDTHIADQLLPPSSEHWMGTDELGRDIFSRVVYGARISLTAAVAAVGLSLLIGIPLGAVAGSFGGWVDNVIMRITDIFLSFPPLLLAIAMVALMGSSLNNAVLAIALSWWPWYTRLIRGQAISVKERKFVQAAETIGTSRSKIIFRHIIPNMSSSIIVAASLSIARAILTESSLSFLGFGVRLPNASWGSMLQNAQSEILYNPLLAVFPGLLILITVLSFNVLGDVLRSALEPRIIK